MLLSKPIAQPKPRPTALDRADRRKRYAALDRRESAKVRARSGGRCEVVEEVPGRCSWSASEIHHMIGGRCRSRIAASAKAEHKQHLCRDHHLGITGEVGGKRFARLGGPVPHWTDTYRTLR